MINCHSARAVERIPTPPTPFILYGVLTDGYGTFTMEVRVVRFDTFTDVFKQTQPMLLTDRLREAHFVQRLNNIVFPVEGRYEIDLLANGELLGMTTLSIRKR